MSISYTYQDVYLKPKYSILRTRAEADVSVEFLGRKFALPLVPANMSSVLDDKIAKRLSESDMPYIMHRFGDALFFVERANAEGWKLISISVGVKEADKELLKTIVSRGLRVDWITIDIAQGHSVLMKEMIEFIGSLYALDISEFQRLTHLGAGLKHPLIIAGNVATPEAVRDLTKWGADCVKVGIGGGAACSTKNQTGFHVPMFSCVSNICNPPVQKLEVFGGVSHGSMIEYQDSVPSVPLILDGGVRENGDIAKALVAARKVTALVMCGSVLAACVDAPGENVIVRVETEKSKEECRKQDEWERGLPRGHLLDFTRPDREYEECVIAKRYYGSASAKQKGSNTRIEGFEVEIPCNGLTYEAKYQEIREGLQSAVSYAGGRDLRALQDVEVVYTR